MALAAARGARSLARPPPLHVACSRAAPHRTAAPPASAAGASASTALRTSHGICAASRCRAAAPPPQRGLHVGPAASAPPAASLADLEAQLGFELGTGPQARSPLCCIASTQRCALHLANLP
jgi:hypothetical protein